MTRYGIAAGAGVAVALALAACAPVQAQVATPNDGKDDRDALQARIDEAARQGGGTVQLENGTYDLARPLFLRSGVTLAGRGPGTLLTNSRFNERSDWSGVVLFAGNLNPGSYDDNGGVGYPGLPATPVGETRVDLPGCDAGRLAGLPGEVVWLSTESGFAARNEFARPEYGVMNMVRSVSGCSVTLTDPIGIPAGHEIRLHWSDGSKSLPANVGEPNRAIRDAGVTNLSLAATNSPAMLVTGCYRCSFTDLTMQRTRRLFSIQGTRYSVYRNISGTFTERGIEVVTFATDNTVDGVNAQYLGGQWKVVRPAIRFGEYARNNQLSNIVLNLGDDYADTEKIRFDESGGNRLDNVRFVVAPSDKKRLFLYRAPGSTRGRAGLLPPGTTLRGVELCAGNEKDSCEAMS